VLQFRNTAQRIYANLPPADRARLDDYARGVNLFIEQHQDSLPAGVQAALLSPAAVERRGLGEHRLMMVQMLDTHWYAKLAREQIAAKLHNPSWRPISIRSARGATIRPPARWST
jgi:penicillin G amidase